MKSSDPMNRRDFYLLVAGALGGAVASGTLAKAAWASPGSDEGSSLLLKEPHVCCGLNTCKGHGAGGDNACAGQGSCATAEHHACSGMNDCAGQGGCGAKPGQNDCKGHGKCSVPLSEPTWKKARAAFEAAMNKAGRKLGAAPASCPAGA